MNDIVVLNSFKTAQNYITNDITEKRVVPIMAYFHCWTQIRIRTQTQIPVLCRYYGKGIRI